MTASSAAPALAAVAEPAPSIIAPLRASGYRLLLGSTALWWAARWMETVVLSWLVLQLTDSAWNVALIGFFRTAAMPVLGILGGAIADRYDRRRLLVAVQCLNLTVTVLVALMMARNQLTVWMIYAAAVVMGVGWSVDWPARRSLLPDLVGLRLLHRAVVLDTGVLFLMKIVGPILGGALFVPLGPFGAYVILAGMYLLSIALLAGIRVRTATVKHSLKDVWRNLLSGFRYVAGSDLIVGVLGITFVMNLLVFPYIQMTPVVARDFLGVGPERLGLLLAADGIGTLIGAGLQAKFGDRRAGWVYIGGSLGVGVFLILFALSQWYWVSFVLLLCAGIGVSGFATNQSTIILANVPEDMRGRAMGVLTAAIGTMPLGALLIGALASATSAPLAIIIMAGLCTGLVALITLLSPRLRAH